MQVINPSHFVALSFILFLVIVLILKKNDIFRFIKSEIKLIENEIEEASKKRSQAYIFLKKTSQDYENISKEIQDLNKQTDEMCEKIQINYNKEFKDHVRHLKIELEKKMKLRQDSFQFELNNLFYQQLIKKLINEIYLESLKKNKNLYIYKALNEIDNIKNKM